MTAYEQRSYPGAAPDTTLAAGITSTSLSITVATGTGTNYPTGSSGPFFIVIDYDNSKAEKIRVTSRSGDTFAVASTADRGVDGTTAVAHDGTSAKIRACWTATDAQEANRAAANTVGKVTSKGDLLAGTAANTLTRVPAGTDGQVLTARAATTAGVDFETLTKTARLPHTWTVAGAVAVPSGDTNFIIPFFVPVPGGQTVTLAGARYRINSGTSATVKLQRNGVDVAGFTGLAVTTTAATTSGSQALADGDMLALVVTAVAGSPVNMTFTVYLDVQV
jgi:hypothetical protein